MEYQYQAEAICNFINYNCDVYGFYYMSTLPLPRLPIDLTIKTINNNVYDIYYNNLLLATYKNNTLKQYCYSMIMEDNTMIVLTTMDKYEFVIDEYTCKIKFYCNSNS